MGRPVRETKAPVLQDDRDPIGVELVSAALDPRVTFLRGNPDDTLAFGMRSFQF